MYCLAICIYRPSNEGILSRVAFLVVCTPALAALAPNWAPQPHPSMFRLADTSFNSLFFLPLDLLWYNVIILL